MQGFNHAIIMGTVVGKPKVGAFSTGSKYAYVIVETINSWVDKKTQEKKTYKDSHRINITNPGYVDIVENMVGNGTTVLVVGQIKNRKYIDKQTGQEKFTTEVAVDMNGKLIVVTGADTSNLINAVLDNPTGNIQPKTNAETFDQANAFMTGADAVPF